MRIAMFTETFLPSTDGIVTRLRATLNYLEQEGHEVLMFAPSGAPAKYASATIVGIPAMPFILYPEKRYALPLPRIGRAIKRFQPDLIHAVNPAFLGLGGIYYAWRYHLPLIASYHTNVPAYARHYKLNFLEPALWWYFRTLHNRADINLATSRATMNELEKQGFLNLGLWERGVDVELFQQAKRSTEMRRRLAPKAGPNDPVLLYVGRLASEKNIERIRPCLDEFPDLHLAIVGDGPYRRDLEQIFAGTNAHFTGYMHGAELAEAYASADAFLFPSTTETLGLVLFEAMATGLPVLAADSPPTREVLENGRAGFIFDSSSDAAMIECVRQLLTDDERRRAIQQRGLEIAKTLDWEGPSRQLLEHYEAVCKAHKLVPRPVQSGTR
ncbi:glycosyltransferase family 4 protein [Alicyclobacillus acidoterrestris]|uniref:Glycosyltransferase family 1 protein n=1 Tax=Alicyclobacillus acidoterrestris (strain ATCC 49025 / DSM 3922 / CIP 106132 / NCIMB 13137 / GD3B) TaxID=1356854 RepID=T0CFI7_ALIAG|nr:glycosyltransferase family 1 protein [Alicyclobacillus acidoterrestris]EPZ51574.1 glycosyl transferase [Alicyclobacillus acidoterrestris ATCC 49025]UNO50632.1 glycosyltransferase family 1 protein [Alicyclobacillus acidoterrestris]